MATPTPSASLIAQLRRMTAEPITSGTYSDPDLQEMIARYPLPDALGHDTDDLLWAGAWDVSLAAADVWEEKAAAVAAEFDFSADGGDYTRSQKYAQYMQMARNCRAKRKTGALELIAHPKPLGATRLDGWIGNLPELDEGIE